MNGKTCQANGSTTVVIVPATKNDEGDLIAKLRQFAWDEPMIRFARLNPGCLAVDLAQPADEAALLWLHAALGRPVRTAANHPDADWRPIMVFEEDG